VTSTRRVQFTHAECNFYIQDDVETQKCDNDTHDCDLNSHKSDLYTQSVMLTRISVIMTRMSVILTLTKVIMTHIRVKTTLCRPQIALRWTHDQKTRRPTTNSSIQSQTQWKEKSKKTEIQVGGWGEQR
jgi:hypothetical protein